MAGIEIEIEISNILRRAKNPVAAATKLLTEMDEELLNRRDFLSIVNFALNAGAHRALADAFERWFRKSPHVPWPQFMELLHRQKVKVTREVVENVMEGARLQENLEVVAQSYAWDAFEPRIAEIRKSHGEALKTRHAERREALKEKLSFTRIHRLIDEEEKVLNQLHREYPDDTDVQREREVFKDRWAREVIARSRTTHIEGDAIELTEPDLTEEERRFADAVHDFALARASSQPEDGYNLALTFRFMGLHESALAIARKAPASVAVDWLIVELLYESRRYIDCLEKLHQVEMQYCEDPETFFGANYVRALCLWELNQAMTAIELMRSIVNVRTSYRSARSYLTKWSGGLE